MQRIKRIMVLPIATLLALCFMGASWADSTPPTVSARTSGTTLYITATDDNSGIATVRINGLNLPNATEGEMEVGLAGYTTTKTLSIQAVDNAGNNSSTVTLENPCYGMDLSMQETATAESTDTAEKSESATTATAKSAQATETSVATVTTTTTTQAAPTANDSPTADAAEKSTKEPTLDDNTEVAEDTDEEEVTDELTPDGDLTLVDDVVEENAETLEDLLSGKQFLTVSTRNGNYFYLIIDRDGETENVYFLNQVDESDLLALIEDEVDDETIEETEEEAEETPVCTCTTRCEAGQVNTACVVCSIDLDDCEGEEPEEEEEEIEEEPVEAEDTSSGRGRIFIVIVLLVLLGGGVAAYFKFFRQPPVNNTLDPDDWDDEDEPTAESTAEDSVEHEVIDL